MATGAYAVSHRWPVFFVGAAAACLGFAPGAAAPAGGDVLRVGVYQNRPLVFVDPDGRVRGVYVDVLDGAAEAEGWSIRYVPGTWQECLDRLAAGRIDLLTGIAFTEEREERYDFSRETILANWCQVYTAPNAQIQTFLDLRGKTIAAVEGDVYRERFVDLADRFEVTCAVIDVSDPRSVLEAVAEGEADAGLVSRVFGALNEDEFEVRRSPVVFAPTELRFAAPQGRHGDVLAALDEYVSGQKEDAASAYYHALERWLRPAERQVVPPWALRGLSVLAVMLLLAGGAAAGYRVRLRASGRALRAQRRLLDEEGASRRRVQQDLAARERAIRLVYDLSLRRGVSVTSTCDHLVREAAGELDAEYVAVCRCSGDQLEVVAEAIAGRQDEKGDARAGVSEFCHRVFEGGAVAIERVETTPEADGVVSPGSEGHRSALGTPINGDDGAALGVLVAASAREDAFGPADGRLFETLAAYLGRQFEIDTFRQERVRTRQMELLGQLTSGVAHEVRNPINAILATAEALDLDIGEDPEYGESVRQIRLQVERIAVLMRDLLDLGRPISESSRTACRLEDVCAEAVDLWRKTAAPGNHDVRILLGGVHGAPKVSVDRDRMHQVVLNLLDNAAQHSAEGSEIRVGLFSASGTVTGFQVADAGAGVSTEDLPHLFEPFYTRRKRGTGLGLSIVKHIVESHDGAVSIRNNNPPPGCTVDVLLPVAEEG